MSGEEANPPAAKEEGKEKEEQEVEIVAQPGTETEKAVEEPGDKDEDAPKPDECPEKAGPEKADAEIGLTEEAAAANDDVVSNAGGVEVHPTESEAESDSDSDSSGDGEFSLGLPLKTSLSGMAER